MQWVRTDLANYKTAVYFIVKFFSLFEATTFSSKKITTVRKPYLLPCRRDTSRGTWTENVMM